MVGVVVVVAAKNTGAGQTVVVGFLQGFFDFVMSLRKGSTMALGLLPAAPLLQVTIKQIDGVVVVVINVAV
jgi:hypothetical protein